MNLSVTDVSPTRKQVRITVPGDEISREEETLLQEFSTQVRIPGFRPGKAPATLLRTRYKKPLQDELNRKVAQKVYEKVVNDDELKVYSIVQFNGEQTFLPGQETEVEMTVDVTPSFEMPPYEGISVSPPSTEVADEEIERTITDIRRQRADFKKVERPAQTGDYLQISYTGSINGQPVAESLPEDPRLRVWGTASNAWEEAGTDEAKQFGVPGVIDGIVGMSAGEKKEVTATFPEDFPVEALRGQTATYAVEVHEVRERVLPELDEAFLKSLRADSVEDLKAQILDQLEARKRREAENAKRQQILEHLDGAITFPLPESAVEQETQNIMGRVMVENMQRGVPEEEFEKNKEAFHAQSSQMAAREVKRQLILSQIAKKESITVTDEDFQRAIFALAQQQRTTPEELVKELRRNRNRVLGLQRQILFSKTLDYLVAKAKLA